MCAGDLRQLQACERLLAPVEGRQGRCDVLVNPAGATRAGAFQLSDELWPDGLALKLLACVLIGGSVNAAIADFTKRLAGLGKRSGVDVNAIHPGVTETERVGQLLRQRADAQGITPDEMRARMLDKDGLRRFGRPEDVAALAPFPVPGAGTPHPGDGDRGRRRGAAGAVLNTA